MNYTHDHSFPRKPQGIPLPTCDLSSFVFPFDLN